MNDESDAADACRLIANLIAAGLISEPRITDAKLHAIRITSPDGAPAGWFVALVIADRLIGFAQLDEAHRFRRYSSLAGREPAAAAWLESAAVLSLARARAAPDLRFGEPFLSYDDSPDRLAWIVPATGPDGTASRLFVAGREVFERRAQPRRTYTPRTEADRCRQGRVEMTNKPSDPFQLLVGKALIDEKYRALVLKDRKGRIRALKQVGVENPTEDQLTALQNAIQTLETLSLTFGEEVGAA